MIRVAIDGPAGVGKSSTSKALARHFGFAYLDTGAMYRACAWWCLHQGIDLDGDQVDEQQITEAVAEFFTGDHFDIGVDPDHPSITADGEDISEAIRSSEVSSHVSKVSNVIPVRHVLIAAQRAYIARESAADSFSLGRGIVAEGRDITTVVAPDAEVRVLLTAREEVRQARRTGQAVAGAGVGGEDVAARDRADSKVTSFLTAADGVTTVDNSDMDFQQTLDVLITLVADAVEVQEYEQYAANLSDYELDEGDEQIIAGSRYGIEDESPAPKAVGVLAVVGRPNVGKSTLIKLILNMTTRDAGRIEVLGLDAMANEERAKEQLGVVLDSSYFIEYMTVDAVERTSSPMYPLWDHNLFDAYLRRFGLGRNKKIKDLSRGMQMKLMLAVALSHDAKLLILDEPTSGLDVLSRDELMDILSDYVADGGHSVIFSTHITADLERCADFLAYITNGMLYYSGPKDEFEDAFRLVKGGPDELTDGLRRAMVGIRTYATGFDALVRTQDIPHTGGTDGLLTQHASIEDVIRLTNAAAHTAIGNTNEGDVR